MTPGQEAAFPVPGFPGEPGYTLPTDGMTLRQYFAGQALKTLVGVPSFDTIEETASLCCKYADALLTALKDKE